MKFKYSDVVKPATESDASTINRGFRQVITKDTELKVILVIRNGADAHSPNSSGLVVTPLHSPENSYPYVWNFERFVKS